jgi:hypothetical protein
MEYWELFIRGVGRSVEEFVKNMIEKGKDDSNESEIHIAQPKIQKKRVIPRRDLGDMEEKIVDVVEKFHDGCTLKDIAKALDMQWHYLRIPLRQMVMDRKIIKDGKVYFAPSREEPEEKVVQRNGVKRRIVDAKALDEPSKKPEDVEKITMNPREREILRFKILTAFRGRPEGLEMKELAAVLGRSTDGLMYILKELINENKVVEGKGGKFHLS